MMECADNIIDIGPGPGVGGGVVVAHGKLSNFLKQKFTSKFLTRELIQRFLKKGGLETVIV